MSRIKRELEDLVGQLGYYSGALSKRHRQKREPAGGPHEGARERTHGTVLPPPAAVVAKPGEASVAQGNGQEPSGDKEHAREKGMSRYERISLACAVVAALSTFGYAIVTFYQWRAISDTNEINRHSVEEMRVANRINAKALGFTREGVEIARESRRARVISTEVRPSTYRGVAAPGDPPGGQSKAYMESGDATFTNQGPVVAPSVRVVSACLIYLASDPTRVPCPARHEPPASLPASEKKIVELRAVRPPTSQEIDALISGKKSAFLIAEIEYDDGTGAIYRTRTCYREPRQADAAPTVHQNIVPCRWLNDERRVR